MAVVFDACAIIAWLRDEPGADMISEIIKNEDCCYLHAINAYEVYHDFLRVTGKEEIASNAIEDIKSVVEVIENMETQLWKTAADVKINIKKISIPDCFAIALAKRINAPVVTADHKEFIPVKEKKICEVIFFGILVCT
ncbi:PIN domain-containing protein [Carboxydocella sp. JDF658]|uniref:PIN domain-containing protein n=1 Tax=Carboxydocella sp. JDF658 TaxID=1926600 RepID=UPI0009AD96C4|nr:PIN domain-containing protein [Carboxydocella sp. JDF658]GAW30897.1 PIN domain protein [Carboxydocella sp. JDF658]